MSKFRIFGQIIDETGKGIPHLGVEVWDKDAKNDDLCGSCETNKNGEYAIEFDESAFKDSSKDILPDVYLKIFDGEQLLETTKVQKNTPEGETEINVELSIAQPSTTKNSRRSKTTNTAKSRSSYASKKTSSATQKQSTQLENKSAANQAIAATAKQESSPSEEKSTILATGLEDYGRWKAMFKDKKQEDDPPFRRGRIWA